MDLLLCQSPACPAPEVDAAAGWDARALTRRMVAGEELAYREFYAAYYERLHRYLLVAAGDEQAALDALAATLARVVRHIKVFPTEEVFWSWLSVLARSAFSDQTRKQRRYLALLERFARQSSAERSGPDSAQADARLRGALARSLEALSPADRQLVDWKYFDRRSVRDIARELQASEKAVDSRLVRVRRKLRETVLRELNDD